jgi:hypothetical protein
METVTLRPKTDRRKRPRFPPAAIARCAYELYQRRGGEPGHDTEDWLQAERELAAVATCAHRLYPNFR